jgi:hypothetical protein
LNCENKANGTEFEQQLKNGWHHNQPHPRFQKVYKALLKNHKAIEIKTIITKWQRKTSFFSF